MGQKTRDTGMVCFLEIVRIVEKCAKTVSGTFGQIAPLRWKSRLNGAKPQFRPHVEGSIWAQASNGKNAPEVFVVALDRSSDDGRAHQLRFDVRVFARFAKAIISGRA